MPFKNESILLTDFYELTMCASYFKEKLSRIATFDLFIRDFPKNRSYFIAAGLEDALSYLTNLKFSKEQIVFLRSQNIFKRDFLDYLKNFRFSGDAWAMPEGTVFFPNEPVLRVSAPIVEAQLVETYLLNTINLNTTLATKASRVVLAAAGRPVVDFSLRRTQGMDAGMKVARASFIAGCLGTSNVLAGMKYGIPVFGTMAHSFVMSFTTEEESFRAYAKSFPDNTILLVDTYDTLKGIKNAVKIAKELELSGHKLKSIRLDSGNLFSLSRAARKILDNEGLSYVKIFASGNLDEYKVSALLKKGAQIDAFGVGTAMGVSRDAPYCDVIYKLSELRDNQDIFPVMKLSKHKVTYPGKKQLWRTIDKKGNLLRDVLGLENERIKGKKLLIKVMEKGRLVYRLPSLEEIRKNTAVNLAKLPLKYKELKTAGSHPVEISPQLAALTEKLTLELKKTIAPMKEILFFDIDTQHDFIDKRGRLYVPQAEKIVPNLKKITRFAKINDITVIASTDWHSLSDSEIASGAFGAHCLRGTAGQKKIRETTLSGAAIVPFRKLSAKKIAALTKKNRLIIRKEEYDIFSNPNLIPIIKGAKTAYVYGVATDYCVKAAVLRLCRLGVETYVVKDAIKPVTKHGEKEAFRLFKKEGVKFIRTENLVKRF